MMRISLPAMNNRRWNWPWKKTSWKGLLYLTIFVFISGRLFVGQGFSLTLSSTAPLAKSDSIASDGLLDVEEIPKHGDRSLKMAFTSSTWSSSPSGQQVKGYDYAIGSSVHTKDSIEPVNQAHEEDNILKNNPEYLSTEIQMKTRKSKRLEGEADILKGKDHRYWYRSERIKQVCRRRGVVSNLPVFTTSKNETQRVHPPNLPISLAYVETPVTSHFSLASSFQTMGCFLNKVASSSLVSAFLLVHGLGPTFSSPHSLTFHLFPRSLEDFQFSNQTFFKFLFVRHPMDRMLSCFLDKMIESPHFSLPAFRTYVRNKARKIMMHRKSARQLEAALLPKSDILPSRNLLWNQPDPHIIYGRRIEEGNDLAKNEVNETETQKLHRYVEQRSRPNSTMMSSMKPDAVPLTKKNKTEIKPTFEEFLEFVLDTDLQGRGYDSHWVPFHRYCTPCSVPYHVVGKLETAADDFQYIWSKTGLETQVPVPWINRNTAAPSKSKIALEKKYYSSLPRELILRFYEAFRLDFEMFDYSINDILVKAGYETIEENVNDSEFL